MQKKLSKHEEKILYSGFSDTGEDFDRDTVNKYSKNIRGSVRLATGKFYTDQEMKDRADKAFAVKF